MLRIPLSFLSPAGARGRLSILTFHRVLPQPDPLFPELPDAAGFEAQMRWVRDWFNVVPLQQGIEMLYAGTVPSRALAITFDDGYTDNEEIAAPILKRLGLGATFFVSTRFLDGSCMWNDQVVEAIRRCPGEEMNLEALGLRRYSIATVTERQRTIISLVLDVKHFEAERRRELVAAIEASAGSQAPKGLMMSPDQVRELRNMGMQVGAHTVSHPILTRLSAGAALEEIARSKAHLEDLLQERVDLFAYPNGMPRRDYAAEHVQMVRECGFKAAVTTAQGAASSASDRFQLPRFAPWDRDRLRYGARLLGNFNKPELLAA